MGVSIILLKIASRFRSSKIPYILGIAVAVFAAIWLAFQTYSDSIALNDLVQIEYFQTSQDEIELTFPHADSVIQSPLVISGSARGNWYFEGVFQVTLVDWDGRIIAQSYIEARSDWMTEEFVPFEGKILFDSPIDRSQDTPDFMKHGTLILRKANPSGLSGLDGTIEVPVKFE